MPHSRLAMLDIARMVCIILVVIGHYDPADAPTHYSNMRMVIYTFHMPVFLFISGYLYIVTRKSETFTAFITKKIKRLFPVVHLDTAAGVHRGVLLQVKKSTPGTLCHHTCHFILAIGWH